MDYYINKIVAAWLTWVAYQCGAGSDKVIELYEDILERIKK